MHVSVLQSLPVPPTEGNGVGSNNAVREIHWEKVFLAAAFDLGLFPAVEGILNEPVSTVSMPLKEITKTMFNDAKKKNP